MNDPINDIQPLAPDTKQDSASEQSLINDALNPTAQTSTTTTTTTTPTTPSPLSMTPTPPQPMTTTETTTANVSMGDDTPLAFASLPSAPSTTTTTTSTVNAPITTTESAYIPPTPELAPAPTTIEVVPVKGKSNMGKIVALFLGFLMLGGAVFGGYTYYVNNFGQSADIAIVEELSRAECHGCHNGGNLVWSSSQDRCRVSGTCTVDDGDSDVSGSIDTTISRANCVSPVGAWCLGCGGFCNVSPSQSCYNIQAAMCGEYQQTGANIVSCQGTYAQKCDECNTCFDRTGECVHDTNGAAEGGTPDGLCAIVDQVGEVPDDDENIGTQYYFCPGMLTETQNGCQILGTPPNPNCYCGTTQEDTPGVGFKSVTMSCGCGTPTNPKHSICNTTTKACELVDGEGADTCKVDADCATVAPTMSCTGLTRTPTTTPVIGTKLTFTCAGVVTPSTAGTLSYKFRYSIDSGATIALANKSTTTAELSITACGSYSVQCQACATLNGVLTCNPTWTGATAQ